MSDFAWYRKSRGGNWMKVKKMEFWMQSSYWVQLKDELTEEDIEKIMIENGFTKQ